MKKILCVIFSLFLCLSSAGCSEMYVQETDAVSMKESVQEEDAISKEAIDTGTLRPQSYGYITGTGPYVWMVMDGFIHCIDIRTRETAAEQPLTFLYPEKEDNLLLTSRGDNVTICAITGPGSDSFRVTLYELTLQNEVISLLNTYDATDTLGFLFDGKTQWMETSLVACAGGILIPALNADWIYQLYLYDPVSQELRELGTLPQSSFTVMLSYGEDILLIGPSEENLKDETLSRISLSSGERETIGILKTDSTSTLFNGALNEPDQTLYYISDGIGYRARIGSGTAPEIFCVAPEETAQLRNGVAAEGVYAFLDEEGRLLYQDTTAILQAERLRILDLMGSELLSDVLPVFNARNPEYLATAETTDDPSVILNEALNQSADHDAYVINLGSDLFQSLAAKEYLGDLSGSGILTEACTVFPSRIRSRILNQEKLTAFPLMLQNSVMLLDVATICKITGLDREELPTDWSGFLKLLGRIGDEGLLEGSGHVLCESGVSAETFRGILITSILQDALLWSDQDEARLSSLAAILTPALQTLDETDLLRLGLAEDESNDGSWEQQAETPYLLTWTEPEIAVMGIPDGMEYWPLSLSEGGEKLVPQDVAVIIMNPRSAHPEGVIRFIETLYEETDDITRMELNRNLSDPVENKAYSEDIEYLKSLIPMFESAISEAQTQEEADEITAEYNEMLAYLNEYEKNGAWLISADSIALYRSLEDLFAIHGDEIWNDETMNSIFFQYMDGMLDAAAFVRQLTSALQMSRMETE